MGYGTFRCAVLDKTKVAYGWEWYVEKRLHKMDVPCVPSTQKKNRGSVSDDCDLGATKCDTLTMLS